jgi:phosphatidylglycerophosphatase A
MAAIEPAEATRARPGLPFLLSHPSHCIALGFGSGLIRPGPGTWGTCAGWLLFAGLDAALHPGWIARAAIGVLGLAVGTWAAARAGAALGEEDAGEIVIDEIVAIWWVLMLLPGGGRPLSMQAAAFVLFRLFDIAKPFPIGAIERRWRNAVGVMLDDLMAAAYALSVLWLWTWVS